MEYECFRVIDEHVSVDTLPCLTEDVAIEPGKEVSFLWRRNDKFYLSESSEVWDQGVVYWDACSTQVRLVEGGQQKKFWQAPVAAAGLPIE